MNDKNQLRRGLPGEVAFDSSPAHHDINVMPNLCSPAEYTPSLPLAKPEKYKDIIAITLHACLTHKLDHELIHGEHTPENQLMTRE